MFGGNRKTSVTVLKGKGNETLGNLSIGIDSCFSYWGWCLNADKICFISCLDKGELTGVLPNGRR